MSEAFKADKDPRKINLGVGAYRDENGKPYVLPSVQAVCLATYDILLNRRLKLSLNNIEQAEDKLYTAKHDKEYLPITGLGDFTKLAAKLAYGEDSQVIQDGLVASTQSISGTGALRVGAAFLARHYPHAKAIYLPTPSWGNHTPIFRDSGIEVKGYRYFDKKTVGLDFAGLKEDLRVRHLFACDFTPGHLIHFYFHRIQAAPEKSIVLLHACAHNPTGIDPTQEQWAEISDIVKVSGY